MSIEKGYGYTVVGFGRMVYSPARGSKVHRYELVFQGNGAYALFDHVTGVVKRSRNYAAVNMFS